MYDFYQVKRLHAKFVPYKAQFDLPAAGNDPVVYGQPSFSIIDPNDTFPPNTLLTVE